jgi:hypothetical protein
MVGWQGCLHGADAFDSGAAMLAMEENSFINIFMDTAGERNIQLDSYYKERESERRRSSLSPACSRVFHKAIFVNWLLY